MRPSKQAGSIQTRAQIYGGMARLGALRALEALQQSSLIGLHSRQSRILDYLVQEELNGRGERIKAYAIGVDVLGRPPSFDPSSDSIVRVELKRLRQTLQTYYASIGSSDLVEVTIPKGNYRPVFLTKHAELPKKADGSARACLRG